MFDSNHYVPVLKWKRAEQSALKTLGGKGTEDHITPLIELVMPKPKLLYKDGKKKIRKTDDELFEELIIKFKQERIPMIPEEILKSWGYKPIFLDFGLLYTTQLKVEGINKIATKGADLRMHLIPVLNLSDDNKIKAIVCSLSKQYKKGMCLRIVPSDLANMDSLNERIEDFLRSFDLTEKWIDLLVDIKEIKQKDDKYPRYTNRSQEIRGLTRWRSFIFASGAFPKDLTECKLDDPNSVPRLDWINWGKHTEDKDLKRNPTFADYTMRHPIYDESLQFYHPTTSIKYALPNEWLVMKGEKQKFELYLANAKLLCEDSRFYGEKFSDGDRYIVEKARHFGKYIRNPNIKGTGSTETWLRACINHHLTLVAHQIANLA